MKQAIREKWVAALRSGDYEQGKKSLRQECHDGVISGHTYCCLGVLVDLAIRDGVGVSWEWDAVDSDTEGFSFPPAWVWEDYAGMKRNNPDGITMQDGGSDNTLSGWNDDGKTFLEIATAIEEQLI